MRSFKTTRRLCLSNIRRKSLKIGAKKNRILETLGKINGDGIDPDDNINVDDTCDTNAMVGRY